MRRRRSSKKIHVRKIGSPRASHNKVHPVFYQAPCPVKYDNHPFTTRPHGLRPGRKRRRGRDCMSREASDQGRLLRVGSAFRFIRGTKLSTPLEDPADLKNMEAKTQEIRGSVRSVSSSTCFFRGTFSSGRRSVFFRFPYNPRYNPRSSTVHHSVKSPFPFSIMKTRIECRTVNGAQV
jgi:hypothetical protein